MASLGAIARKVLNLPEPAPRTQAPSAAPPSVSAQQPPGNPWEEAGARLRAQEATRVSAQTARSSEEPWVTHDERSGALFAKRFGRGLLWAVVGLAAVTGVRAWIVPNTSQAPAPTSTRGVDSAYPTDQAQAVAARWARAYLSWDEANAKMRGQLLAADMPSDADTEIGWDGHGHQEVVAVQPGAVTTGAKKQARARVDVLVRTEEDAVKDTKKGKGRKPPEPTTVDRWIGLDVPVVATAGRVVVTGQPGIVGIPASGPHLPELPTGSIDQELSGQTQSAIESFFRSYAAGDTRSGTAPGANIPPLPDGFELGGLTAWQVDQGRGADRIGTARVSWRIAGAVIEQTYRVEITQVSSADAQRWQVSDVHGGTT
jgi:hypothetical protein